MIPEQSFNAFVCGWCGMAAFESMFSGGKRIDSLIYFLLAVINAYFWLR